MNYEKIEYITYDEFEKEVEKLGFEVTYPKTKVWVEADTGWSIISISKDIRYTLTTDNYETVTPEIEKLRELSVRLAITPIEDRKESKKYRLKFQPPGLKTWLSEYLNYFKESDEYTIMDSIETSDIQTKFTEKEIDELDRKSNILTLFVKEEVND